MHPANKTIQPSRTEKPPARTLPCDKRPPTQVPKLEILELESESNLTFASGKHLLQCAEREVSIRRGCLHCGGILAVE